METGGNERRTDFWTGVTLVEPLVKRYALSRDHLSSIEDETMTGGTGPLEGCLDQAVFLYWTRWFWPSGQCRFRGYVGGPRGPSEDSKPPAFYFSTWSQWVQILAGSGDNFDEWTLSKEGLTDCPGSNTNPVWPDGSSFQGSSSSHGAGMQGPTLMVPTGSNPEGAQNMELILWQVNTLAGMTWQRQ